MTPDEQILRTPAEIMARADHELDAPRMPWDRFKEIYPESADRKIRGAVAMLRALAAIEPTATMGRVLVAAQKASELGDLLDIWRDCTLAAAEEGEAKP